MGTEEEGGRMRFFLPFVALLAGCTKIAETPLDTSYAIQLPPAAQADKPLYIQKDGMVLMADRNYGASITSLSYVGYEFVDVSDHGREIQSAASFDSFGECYNPTEAGNYVDTDKTTSIVNYAGVSGNVLDTVTDAAFWVPAGYIYLGGKCGTALPAVYAPQNKTNTGGYLTSKTVSFGTIPNSVHFKLGWVVPNPHVSGTFEFTGYLKQGYSDFYTVQNGELVPLLAGETENRGEQSYPIVVTDGFTAMGVYSPTLPQSTHREAGYGRWKFSTSRVNKWNMVWRDRQIPEGKEYKFDAWLCVGYLDDVKKCMNQLIQTGGRA